MSKPVLRVQDLAHARLGVDGIYSVLWSVHRRGLDSCIPGQEV